MHEEKGDQDLDVSEEQDDDLEEQKGKDVVTEVVENSEDILSQNGKEAQMPGQQGRRRPQLPKKWKNMSSLTARRGRGATTVYVVKPRIAPTRR